MIAPDPRWFRIVFFAPFSRWFLTPKMRYYLYVWSSDPSQGDPAQVA